MVMQKINLDNIEGSWKNSQESLGPVLIKDPTSVADRANFYKISTELVIKLHRACRDANEGGGISRSSPDESMAKTRLFTMLKSGMSDLFLIEFEERKINGEVKSVLW
jgi:hypothetical protein